MKNDSIESKDQVFNERLRQEKESFDQHKLQSERWFQLRLIMGYVAVVLLPSIFILCVFIIIYHTYFSDTVVASATATLFVDAVGIVYSIWKIVLNPKFATKIAPITESKSKIISNNSKKSGKEIVASDIKGEVTSAELKILEAKYGTEGKSFDVKDILQQKIAGGRIEMFVRNESLGGDPDPFVHKVLKIVYSYSDEIRTITVHEGKMLSIP